MIASSNSSTSIWSASLDRVPTSPRAALNATYDVAVVGAGLTGLSAAYHVLHDNPRATVVVLEANRLGHGASSRNTGMLTPGVGQSLASLVNRFGESQARQMYITSSNAVKYVGDLLRKEGFDAEHRETGQLVVAMGRSGNHRLEKQASLFERLDLPCERLDKAALERHIKLGIHGQGQGPEALRLPVAGTLHPGKMLSGLATAIQRRGGQLVENAKVQSVSRGKPAVISLATGETLRARQVIMASNGYASGVKLQQGRLIPMHLRVIVSEPLSNAELDSIGWRNREGVIDSRRVFNYFRLTTERRIVFGGGLPRYRWGGSTADLHTSCSEQDPLVREFRRVFPTLDHIPIERSWGGVISYSLDTLPVISRAKDHQSVFHVGGWCGHGIALSILSGSWIPQLLAQPDVKPMPWFRTQAPRLPTELARWIGVQAGGRMLKCLDYF